MIKPLTSLRMFFALFVFFSHLSFLRENESYVRLFNSIFDEGFLGVSFFFILSGFILAYNYKEKVISGGISKKAFYVARFARVYPIHFVTMLAALAISLVSSTDSMKYLLPQILLLQSFFSDSSVFFSLNAPSWSISNEMYFYLLFPFVIILSVRSKIILFIMYFILILLLNSKLDDELKHYWLYISPLIRFSDFLLGILLFELFSRVRPIYSTMSQPTLFEFGAIVLFCVFFIPHQMIELSFRYSIYYWIPMSAIVLVFALSSAAETRSVFTRVLSNKYLVWAGEISFCFYLIHFLAIQVINYIRVKFLPNMDLIVLSIIIFLLTLIASAIAYRHIEKPLNKKVKEYLL